MDSSQVPANFNIPFANNAGGSFIRTIPQAHSATPGAASLFDGFPPACFNAPEAGGVPPFGQDFNGILNWITSWVRWQQAGGFPGYSAPFSSAIGGYPLGAVLKSADGTHFWESTAENNVTNPDAAGAGWQVLQPGSYPWSSITGAPSFVLNSQFTGSNQSLGSNGYQKLPGGLILQNTSTFVAGAANTVVSVTYPIAFPTASGIPIPSVVDPSESGGASNTLGLSIVSYSTTGCTVALAQNGGGARDVTLGLLVPGH